MHGGRWPGGRGGWSDRRAGAIRINGGAHGNAEPAAVKGGGIIGPRPPAGQWQPSGPVAQPVSQRPSRCSGTMTGASGSRFGHRTPRDERAATGPLRVGGRRAGELARAEAVRAPGDNQQPAVSTWEHCFNIVATLVRRPPVRAIGRRGRWRDRFQFEGHCMSSKRVVLTESEMPGAWYNILADLPEAPPPR